jgi:hypothetical protein
MVHANEDSRTSARQVAVAALVAILFLNVLAAANTIAQTRIAPPIEVFPAIFADVGWSAFTLPLLLWRSRVGYASAVAVGALSLTWPFLVLLGFVGELGPSVTLSPLGILTYLSLPLVLITASVLASRGAAPAATASRLPTPAPAEHA